MTFALFLVALVVCLGLCWRFLGAYLIAVYENRLSFLGFIERPIYRLLGTDKDAEQSWKRYAASMVVFSGVSVLFIYLILALQGHLPLNPQHFSDITPALDFNTSVSFLTNTNWQNYAGETTMSYFSQMFGLEFHQFISAAVGLALAVAVIRGFANRGKPTIGNFWVDMTRSCLYVLFPLAFVFGIVFVGQGAVDTLHGPVTIHNALTGLTQTVALGPVGFMEAIKQLGTNGGGFFNINSAHPFENPTGLTNFMSLLAILCLPISLTYVFGKVVGQLRQGVAVLTAMLILYGSLIGLNAWAEARPNAAVTQGGVAVQVTGNVEGKEVRFGVLPASLFAVTSTATSTGSADYAYDSGNPWGNFALLSGMMLGEVAPGGVGSGLYTILLMAIIAVFIGGLMIGRTPEYLGKKIQAREVKLAGIGVLVMPITVLILTGIAVSVHAGKMGPLNAGPHGFSEILYAFTSQGNNNGSAFGGLTGNTPFYNIMGSVAMLLGRFGVAIPALALAGSLARSRTSGPSPRGSARSARTTRCSSASWSASSSSSAGSRSSPPWHLAQLSKRSLTESSGR